ncbi:MAG TPA: N-acetylmuramoyl-L-alanine amidase [Chloroflexota bacterium]|nr:N-acetylmuramoyl-L-alanine amidase [Chloroflexota bacterium]
MVRALVLLVLVAACAPAPGPAPAASAPPAVRAALAPGAPPPAVAPPPVVARAPADAAAADPPAALVGADPLEGEPAASASDDAGAAPARNEPIQGAAPAATALPAWLRAVREPPPVRFVGSGRPGPKRVGLQVGHWGNESLPAELDHLRASGGGAVGGGYTEVQINYDLAQRTAALLRADGVEVDVLPAAVPVDYEADAFVAIHADGDARGALRGYKVARSPMSQIPTWDDALVGWLYAEYGRLTGLPRDDAHVTRRMQFYYAFNNRRYYAAVAPSTPAAIIETGFVTSAADRALLVGDPDRAAAGLAASLRGFLGIEPEP